MVKHGIVPHTASPGMFGKKANLTGEFHPGKQARKYQEIHSLSYFRTLVDNSRITILRGTRTP
jgi:hypothetical protein